MAAMEELETLRLISSRQNQVGALPKVSQHAQLLLQVPDFFLPSASFASLIIQACSLGLGALKSGVLLAPSWHFVLTRERTSDFAFCYDIPNLQETPELQ